MRKRRRIRKIEISIALDLPLGSTLRRYRPVSRFPSARDMTTALPSTATSPGVARQFRHAFGTAPLGHDIPVNDSSPHPREARFTSPIYLSRGSLAFLNLAILRRRAACGRFKGLKTTALPRMILRHLAVQHANAMPTRCLQQAPPSISAPPRHKANKLVFLSIEGAKQVSL